MKHNLLNSTKLFSSVLILLVLLTSSLVAQNSKEAMLFFTNKEGKKVFSYNDTKVLFVKVINVKKNIDVNKKDQFSIVVSSEMEPDGEQVMLTETGKNTDIYIGNIKFKNSPMPFANSKHIEVAQGDKLTAKFVLSKNEQGVEDVIFDNAYYKGPDWTFFNTGANHIVLLSPDIVITIDGKPAEHGIFISAFYKKGSDDKSTYENGGGTGKSIAPGGVRWVGKVNAIALWGTQDGKNNGFAEGEEFAWKIWNPKDGKVYTAVATYIENDERITHRGTYTKDGISGIIALKIVTKGN